MRMTSAGVYIRVSSDRQAREGESLPMQEARARELCDQHGWEMLPVYCDILSGKSTKRPALKRFEEDMRAGRFQAAICYKVDRLGRNRRHLPDLLMVIRERNVQLVSMTQQIDMTTAGGRFMLDVLIAAATFEVEQMGERISDTLLHIGKQGRPTGGSVPYGYVYHPKHDEHPGTLEIIEAEAEVVRIAFERYLASTITGTAKALNQGGYRTRSGAPWDATAIRTMILNPLYGGERALRRFAHEGGRPKKKAQAIAEMADWLIVQSLHEPIVSAQVAKAARDKYARERAHPETKRSGKSAWSGLIVCDLCGSRLHSYDAGPPRGKYMRCKNTMAAACALRMVSVDWLERGVWPLVSAALEASMVSQARGAKAPKRPEVPRNDRMIAAKMRELERLELRFDNEIITGETYLRERKRVQGEIQALQTEASSPPALPPLEIPHGIADALEMLSLEDSRDLLRLFIREIRVDGERALVHLHAFSSGHLPDVLEVARAAPYQRIRRSWGPRDDRCKKCGTQSTPHCARGLCKPCYERDKRKRRRLRQP